MKKLLKKVKKNSRIIIMSLLGTCILLIVGYFIQDTFFISEQEKENREFDRYNFEQLEKVKSVLKDVPQEKVKFRNLKDFNKKYSQNITPMKNCYYMVTTNFFKDYTGKSSYIFGFQLESEKYKRKYKDIYYAYPKYDLPVDEVCAPSGFVGAINKRGGCTDMRKSYFNGVISNPCRD